MYYACAFSYMLSVQVKTEVHFGLAWLDELTAELNPLNSSFAWFKPKLVVALSLSSRLATCYYHAYFLGPAPDTSPSIKSSHRALQLRIWLNQKASVTSSFPCSRPQ